MKALVFGRISVAKAGWLIVAFVVAWPLYVLLPFGSRPSSPPTPREDRPIVISKLSAVGLAPNVDWDGMPELFAVWAKQAEWLENKTQFAYWNPGSRSYSYFFEAMRDEDRIRFRAITKEEALTWKEMMDDGSGAYVATDAGLSPAELRSVGLTEPSPTHPFLFFKQLPLPLLYGPESRPSKISIISSDPAAPQKVDVSIPSESKQK